MTSPLSPEAVAQMVADLTIKATMINMGEKIAWGSDSGVMDAAADMLRTLAAENWEAIPRALLPRLNGKYGRDYEKAPAALKPVILNIAKLEHAARMALKQKEPTE